MKTALLVIVAALGGAATVLVGQWLQRQPPPTAPAPQAPTVATVDGRPITVADFTAEMERRGGVAVFPTTESRRALLDDMIRVAVLAANGRARGYLDGYDVRRDVDHVLAGKYQQEVIQPQLDNQAVNDDEVQAYYRAHAERFTIPAAARAAIIFFRLGPHAPADAAARLRERVAQVQAAAQQQQGETLFGALAAQNSDDQASRYFGGDTGWIVAGQKDSRFEPAVVDAVFALDQPGALAPVVETASGLYLVRLVETKPATLRPLDEVAPAIHATLLAAKRSDRNDALYAAAAARVPVEIHADRLPAGSPQAVPGAQHGAPPPVPQL